MMFVGVMDAGFVDANFYDGSYKTAAGLVINFSTGSGKGTSGILTGRQTEPAFYWAATWTAKKCSVWQKRWCRRNNPANDRIDLQASE